MAARISRLPKPPVIAVVDDDETVRDSLSEFLQVLCLSCRSFACADAFLAAYAPGRFDCLITDIRMPGVSGLELLRLLRAQGSSLPVIVVTSAMDPGTRSRAMEEGATAYLTKPVSDETLIRHLTAALARGEPPGWTLEGREP